MSNSAATIGSKRSATVAQLSAQEAAVAPSSTLVLCDGLSATTTTKWDNCYDSDVGDEDDEANDTSMKEDAPTGATATTSPDDRSVLTTTLQTAAAAVTHYEGDDGIRVTATTDPSSNMVVLDIVSDGDNDEEQIATPSVTRVYNSQADGRAGSVVASKSASKFSPSDSVAPTWASEFPPPPPPSAAAASAAGASAAAAAAVAVPIVTFDFHATAAAAAAAPPVWAFLAAKLRSIPQFVDVGTPDGGTISIPLADESTILTTLLAAANCQAAAVTTEGLQHLQQQVQRKGNSIYTNVQRLVAFTLHHLGIQPAALAVMLNIPKHSLMTILQTIKKTGRVDVCPPRGKQKIELSSVEAERLVRARQEHPQMPLAKFVQLYAPRKESTNTPMCERLVKAVLMKAGVEHRAIQKQKALAQPVQQVESHQSQEQQEIQIDSSAPPAKRQRHDPSSNEL